MSLEGNGGVGYNMAVTPAGYGDGFGGGFGGGLWMIVLIILCLFGGGFGGFGGGFGGGWGIGYDFPWILAGQNNTNNQVSDGFRDQMLNTGINGIQQAVTGGFGDVQTALCGGFAGVNATVNGAQNALAQQLYTNQIADLERSFAAQTASTAGMTALQAQLAQCCCDNRAATADVKYTLATEACATRNADTQNTQAMLNAINGGIQSIKDQLCQDKIDAKNDEIAQLRQENLYARGQASQIAQNAQIIDGVYNRLSQCPVDTTPVYGRTPIWTCTQNVANGGCGCNGNFN